MTACETKWPSGPYRFDDISSSRQDDGLGYVYLDDGGCSPTLAHTGDTALTAVENRALGNLFAAAPEIYGALTDALWAIDNMAAILTAKGHEGTLTDPTPAIRAILAKIGGAS